MAKKEERIKPIILTDEETGDKYTLEFNKESIKFAESRGFKREDVVEYPMTKIPEMFFYAFRKNHPTLARNKTDAILERLGGVPAILNNSEFMERLGQLYAEPYTALPQGDEKNSKIAIEL